MTDMFPSHPLTEEEGFEPSIDVPPPIPSVSRSLLAAQALLRMVLLSIMPRMYLFQNALVHKPREGDIHTGTTVRHRRLVNTIFHEILNNFPRKKSCMHIEYGQNLFLPLNLSRGEPCRLVIFCGFKSQINSLKLRLMPLLLLVKEMNNIMISRLHRCFPFVVTLI